MMCYSEGYTSLLADSYLSIPHPRLKIGPVDFTEMVGERVFIEQHGSKEGTTESDNRGQAFKKWFEDEKQFYSEDRSQRRLSLSDARTTEREVMRGLAYRAIIFFTESAESTIHPVNGVNLRCNLRPWIEIAKTMPDLNMPAARSP
jgi:hypothetical protein